MKLLSLFGILATATLTQAAEPDFTVTTAAKGQNLEVTAKPSEGHHFNVDAPMSLEDLEKKKKYKPKVVKQEKVSFLLQGLKPRKLAVTMYLCDDANTYCKKHVVNASWDGSSQAAATQPSAPSTQAADAPADNVFHGSAKQGFMTDSQKALEKAANENKPLLISFFAIWCPPCNMLDREVISSPEFAKASADFVKLRLDVDAESSWPLKKRYQIGGYPTTVFANSKGEEILRVVGYRPKESFLAEMKTAYDLRAETLASLSEKAKSGDKAAAKRLGMIHFERKEYKDAISYFEKAADPLSLEMALQGRISLAQNEEDVDDQIKYLQQALREFPESPNALIRHSELAELYKGQKKSQKAKEHFAAAIKTGEALVNEPKKLEGYDLILPDVLAYMASAESDLGNEAAARKAWARAAAELRRRANKTPGDRGYNIELGHALAKSGKIRLADEHFTALEKKYPAEFTFYYNHAHMLFNVARNVMKAEKVAEKAFEHSYGDNRIRAAMLLARIKDSTGNPHAALEITKKTISGIKLPEDKGNRTHRYYKQIKALKEELEKKAG